MKILIADDHAIVREGIKQILSSMEDQFQIDEASDGQQALAKLKSSTYDIAILDISMPEISGLDLLQHIFYYKIPCKVLILSLHPEEQYANRAFKLGAKGYITKESTFDEIQDAIRRISAGGRYISPKLAENILVNGFGSLEQMPHETLSGREFQIMLLLAKGQSISAIAGQLNVSPNTVSTYRGRIMKKMGIKTNSDCTMYAVKHELIQ